MTRPLDAVVIGAGPYGLASAAALRRSGVAVRVIGSPMSFWERHMPRGMFLRSPYDASHIGDTRPPLSLDAFERARGAPLARPLPLSDFIAYGHWFSERAALEVDRRHVESVRPSAAGFRLLLGDGEPVECRRVVIAAGISPFAKRPALFDGFPSEVASHSSEHQDLARFAGRHVVVIGGGQSAIESAALLREAGADTEVIMRAHRLHWVGRAPRDGLVGRLLFDRTDVGPALFSHVIAEPRILRRLPWWFRRDATRRALKPGASLWLRERLRNIRITAGTQVLAAERTNGACKLRLDDGSTRAVDHVILATGYRVDVRRYPFLQPELLARLRCVAGHPVLDEGMQSSVPGLYFVGAPAAHSFGPLLRFVAGTQFATRTLVRAVTDERRPAAQVAGDRGTEIALAAQQADEQRASAG